MGGHHESEAEISLCGLLVAGCKAIVNPAHFHIGEWDTLILSHKLLLGIVFCSVCQLIITIHQPIGLIYNY